MVTVRPVQTFRSGRPLFLQLEDRDENNDPGQIERIEISCVIPSTGDEERFVLSETGPNTGVFVGCAEAETDAHASFDGILGLSANTAIHVSYEDDDDPADHLEAILMANPLGIVFDTVTGEPIDGLIVTLLDAATEEPAQVFGDDGTSAFPSSVTSGEAVVDAGGQPYSVGPGGFVFPYVKPGTYRYHVTLPDASGYHFPSARDAEALIASHGVTRLSQPGSFGQPFEVTADPFANDLPLDPQADTLLVTKRTNTQRAAAGDWVAYEVELSSQRALNPFQDLVLTDRLPLGFRLEPDRVMLDGEPATVQLADDGRTFSLRFPELMTGAPRTLRYVTRVTTPRPGLATNIAIVEAGTTHQARAEATILIQDELQASRAHLLGRVMRGGTEDPPGDGLPGIAVYLETGAMTVTDRRGFFRFEGLVPGTHVVQLDTATLPPGATVLPPANTAGSVGSATARMVDLAAGTLWNIGFRVDVPRPQMGEEDDRLDGEAEAGEASAATPTYDAKWLENEPVDAAWVLPEDGFAAVSSATRIVVKHPTVHTIEATLNGEPVDPINFDGVLTNSARNLSASIWSGLNLREGNNTIEVVRRDSFGNERGREVRTVHFASPPVRAELAPDASVLVADGVTIPQVAVQMFDVDGHHAREGVQGRYAVSEPYQAFQEDELDLRTQPGSLPRQPTFTVGEDGIALLRLEPTATSGRVRIQLDLVTGAQEIVADLRADRQDWIVVGLVEGTSAYETVDRQLETLDGTDEDGWTGDGRVALFARGRIRGGWLLTAAYDSDKEKGTPGSLHGSIDPDSYYTVYGDDSDRFENAASRSKLYVKLERKTATALYGDFSLDWSNGTFTAYNRDLHGIMAEHRGKSTRLTAFQSDAGLRFVRDELPGTGLSTDYRLSQGPIVAFSERVVVQTRDTLRPDIVHAETPLSRNIDYVLEYDEGLVRLRQPLQTTTPEGHANYLVVRYELDDTTVGTVRGGRAEWAPRGDLLVGASVVHQDDATDSGGVAGLDLRWQPREDLKVIAEVAGSDNGDERAHAFRAEIQHQGEGNNTRLYAREVGAAFGLGQLNAAATGNRQVGLEGSQRLGEHTAVRERIYDETILGTGDRRQAAEVEVERETDDWIFRGGAIGAKDRRGEKEESSLLATAGLSRKFFDRRFELGADREQAIGGENESLDFPSRTRLGAAWNISETTKLFAEQEFTDGEGRETQWTRLGFQNAPWEGGRVNGTVGRDQRSGRSALGSAFQQTWRVNESLELEGGFEHATVDRDDETTAGSSLSRPLHGDSGYAVLPQESATAAFGGVHWKPSTILYNARFEFRDDADSQQWNFLASAQAEPTESLGVVGSIVTRRRLPEDKPGLTYLDLRLGTAWRPDDLPVVALQRIDLVRNPASESSLSTASWKVLYNGHLNYRPNPQDQWSLHLGAKHVLNADEFSDFESVTTLLATEYRRQLNPRWDVGLHGGLLSALDTGTHRWQGGLSVGRSLGELVWISVGYNFRGFRDSDFSAARYTDHGVFVRFRLRLDQSALKPLLDFIKEE